MKGRLSVGYVTRDHKTNLIVSVISVAFTVMRLYNILCNACVICIWPISELMVCQK